jgi:tRNA threonylcarbamoyladenosine biosynthesis protein TsaB
MIILGIDTATTTASAALAADGKLWLEEVGRVVDSCGDRPSVTIRPNHAESVLPLVEALLKRAGLSLGEISALAVSIGPGSFTGLRIGLSTVKGLAYGSDIPVLGVPTLLAVASRVEGWRGLVCPLLDARKKEVYAAIFRRSDEKLERMGDDLVSSPQGIIGQIESFGATEPCLFVGDGADTYGDLIRGSLGERALLSSGDRYPSIASAVALLATERVRRGETDPLGSLVPIYIRPSEAELKRRH